MAHSAAPASEADASSTCSGCARTVPKPYSFVPLGLALSEKQTPQVVEKVEKPKEQMEGWELSVVLRRQTLYPTELRARLTSAIVHHLATWAAGGSSPHNNTPQAVESSTLELRTAHLPAARIKRRKDGARPCRYGNCSEDCLA